MVASSSAAPAGSQALQWGLVLPPPHSPQKQRPKATGELTLPEFKSYNKIVLHSEFSVFINECRSQNYAWSLHLKLTQIMKLGG